MSRTRRIDLFKWFNVTTLLVFCGVIVMVFLADVLYVNAAAMREISASPDMRSAFMLSIGSSVLTTLISVLIAIPSAYALARYAIPGAVVLDTIVDLLVVMPVLVIGVSLLVFFKMGHDFTQVSCLPLQWLGGGIAACGEFFIYSKAGIVLAQFFCSVPYAVRTIRTTFGDIDPRTEHVAMTLGCSRVGAFRRVTLPLARQGILAGAILCWVRAFGAFGAISLVGGAVRGRTEVLPTAIYLEISIGHIETAIAISLVMMLAATVVLIAARLLLGANALGRGLR